MCKYCETLVWCYQNLSDIMKYIALHYRNLNWYHECALSQYQIHTIISESCQLFAKCYMVSQVINKTSSATIKTWLLTPKSNMMLSQSWCLLMKPSKCYQNRVWHYQNSSDFLWNIIKTFRDNIKVLHDIIKSNITKYFLALSNSCEILWEFFHALPKSCKLLSKSRMVLARSCL